MAVSALGTWAIRGTWTIRGHITYGVKREGKTPLLDLGWRGSPELPLKGESGQTAGSLVLPSWVVKDLTHQPQLGSAPFIGQLHCKISLDT